MRRLLPFAALAAVLLALCLRSPWAPAPTVQVDAVRAGEGAAASRAASPPATPPTSSTTAGEAGARSDAALTAPAQPGLVGRLVHADGAPVAGEIVVTPSDCAAPRAAPVRCDADGRFAVPLPPGRYELRARGAGVPSGTRFGAVWLRARAVHDLGEIVVPDGATLRGRVVDEAQHPVAGARVFVGSVRFDEELGDYVARDADAPPRAAITDAQGAFAFSDLAPGTAQVAALHADAFVATASRELPAGGCGDVEIVLRHADPLHGFVVDEHGEPVAGASVVPGNGEDALWSGTAATTDAYGAFTMRGSSGHLTVRARGMQTQVRDDLVCPPDPLRIVMTKASVLAGRVRGTEGRAGEVRIDVNVAAARSLPPKWAHAIAAAPHPLASDGTFAIEGLPPGTWRVRAVVPGLGSTLPADIDGPPADALDLQLAPDHRVPLRVVDDLGAPVAHAEIARVQVEELPGAGATASALGASWFGNASRTTAFTDADGRLDLVLAAREPLCLAARTPRHLPTGIALAPDAVPAEVTLTLPRAATVHGRATDAALLAHVRAGVQCAPAAVRAQFAASSAFWTPVDANGAFASGPLPPGRYRVTLTLADATGSADDSPCRAPVPLLVDDGPIAPAAEIELAAGADAEVVFALPRLGEVQGRVLASGAPVPGAIVYALPDARRHWVGLANDAEATDAADLQPHVRADAGGRFRFLAASTAPWTLRARHPRGPVWVAQAIALPRADAHLAIDLLLPGGAVRGGIALDAIAPFDRQFLKAQLLRPEEARTVAAETATIAWGDWTLPLSMRRLQQELAPAGRFAFESLPAGAWVLRVGNGFAAPLLVRTLTVRDGDALDLGDLALAPMVAPQLRCTAPDNAPVLLQQLAEGAPATSIAEVFVFDGVCALPQVGPGRYCLRLLDEAGNPTGEPVAFTVRADGACEPATARLQR